jgi:catechol 2,3-dioxygenase-like lactoylglutathione lyase family enzyme
VPRATGIDHLVLTVTDVERTSDFYTRVAGLTPIELDGGRRALAVADGRQKLNLHPAGAGPDPKASRPTPGSADLCLVVDTPPETLLAELAALGVDPELGPVERTGARGPMVSVYVRDPDGNLVELAWYGRPDPGVATDPVGLET